jgi:heptosyltransferase-1
MRVLLVKLSSMGDLIQGLPAITDAMKVYPDLQLDWAIDEAFADIAHWHPAVNKVIKSAHRRWKKDPLGYWKNGEIKAFLNDLRAEEYPKIIDGQSNLKGGIVTALSRGNKYGPDARSAREWGAHFAYNTRFAIDKNMLAITRLRLLFANALGYEMPTTAPDFGLQNTPWPEIDPKFTDKPYLVFVHNASWPTKYWDDAHWRELIHRAHSRDLHVLLPWGSDGERQSAEKIASGLNNAVVLPRFSLSEQASLLRGAQAAVCMDTGLAHMSAAMDTPTVTLYGPTDAHLIGATGPRSAHINADGFDCTPCYKQKCAYQGYRGEQSQCLKSISPASVWERTWALIDS